MMRPPRFVVRTLAATFLTVAFVLSAVFAVVMFSVRERVRGTVITRLESGQRMLFVLEQRRIRELGAQVATLAENPTLKAALDTYQAEMRSGTRAGSRELLETISRETNKLADRIQPDVLAVTDPSGVVVAAAGRRVSDWPIGTTVRAQRDADGQMFVTLPAGVFQIASAPLELQETTLGTLQLATALDGEYARQLSALSGAATVIVAGPRVIASTLPAQARAALDPATATALPSADTVLLHGEHYAVRLLFQDGEAAVYALDSIEASTAQPVREAFELMLLIALGAFLLAGLASLWLARTLARPIGTLSRSLSAMAESRAFETPVARTGSSLEVDALTDTFNSLMQSLAAAEADTRNAYVGTIRALALALDARDPYTAGHSERVSAISVAVGREMHLDDAELDIIRLGALLHDIGKIGISDDVLRKPTALTAEEFEVIKQHPGVGARILRSVPFLAPHLPIVELHHERPDGKGYPHGLRGDEIPLSAQIVHVADAFDAITSARAYRPARPTSDALVELWRFAGTQFDATVVQALASALPTMTMEEHRFDVATFRAARKSALIAFGRA